MTKEEAWKQWLITNNFHTGQADSALLHSSHGQTFSYAWDAATEQCALHFETMLGKIANDLRNIK